jgi:hypothetical protein
MITESISFKRSVDAWPLGVFDNRKDLIGVDDDNDGDSLIGVIASAAEVLELVFDSKKLRFMGDLLMIVISGSFLGKD